MRQMAQIDANGIVVNIIVAGDDWNVEGFVEYNDANPAFIGGTYDPDRDAFIPPKPYPSWVLNEDTCLWDAPVAMPTDGKRYQWDEATVNWVELEPLQRNENG